MRSSQFVIRLVVFCCIVLDPSDGGMGIAIGVTLAILLGAIIGGSKRMFAPAHESETDE